MFQINLFIVCGANYKKLSPVGLNDLNLIKILKWLSALPLRFAGFDCFGGIVSLGPPRISLRLIVGLLVSIRS